MLRSSKRRQARELKKMLDKMNISEVQEFIADIYVEGVNHTVSLHRDALKEIYGFGEARYSRVHEYVSDKLIKKDESNNKIQGQDASDEDGDTTAI